MVLWYRETDMNRKAEEIRIRFLYRDLVLRGKISLPLEVSIKLIGPDCAYHLYSVKGDEREKEVNSKPPQCTRARLSKRGD